MMTTSRI